MPWPWVKPLFYILTFGSLAICVYRFWRQSSFWKQGGESPPGKNWLANVLKYVIGQKKVQGSRPKSGAPMHLLMFWGFLALLLATTLLAIATYAPLIGIPNFHEGLYFLIFETTFDLLGLAFVIGVVWAIWRRLRILNADGASNSTLSFERQDWEGLVILLMLGVTGFMLEAARIATDPQPADAFSVVGYGLSYLMPTLKPIGYVVIWWFHMAWVWAFFIRLPDMRLRHMVTVTMATARMGEKTPGRLEPVTVEQVEATGKVGAAVASDYSQWHLLSIDACMSCGRCTEVCPAHAVGKILDPKQVVADIHEAAVSGESIVSVVSAEALWDCTTCYACEEVCPAHIPHVEMIVDARRHLVAEGALAGSAGVMLRQVASAGHAWGQDGSTREGWMKGLDVPLCRDGKPFEYLFWVGCAGATDPGAIKTTRAVVELLQRAGVSFACLGKEESCTGDPARRTGDEFVFQEQVSKNKTFFEKYTVTKIVTACPHCLNTLRNEYPDFMERVEVFHHSEVLAELVERGDLSPVNSPDGQTTLHDPCYLARVNGQVDAPRAIFGDETHFNTDKSAIVHALEKQSDGPRSLVEPEHFGVKTRCCGAGGGRMWMDEGQEKRPSSKRVRELLETGAEQIAVACPFCRIMLEPEVQQQTDGEVRIVDLAVLLQEANQGP